MKNIYSYFFLFFVVFSIFITKGYSQNKTTDVLKLASKSEVAQDTIRINLLNSLAYSCYKEDVDKTAAYLEEAMKISEAIGFNKGKAKSIYIKGLIELEKSNYKGATAYFNDALLLYEKLNLNKDISKCYAKLGLAFYYDSNYNEAINNYKKSIEVNANSNQLRTTAISLKYIGYCYADLGNYNKAQEYYERALDLNIKNNNQIEVSNCYLAIGGIFIKKANYPMSLKYSTYSLEVSEAINDTLGISKALNNLGIIYKNYGKYDQAITTHERSLAIQRKIGSERNISKALDNLGSAYIRKRDYKTALSYYNEALSISDEINDKYSYAKYLIKIGSVYGELEEYDTALQYFERSKDISFEIGYKLGICNAYRVNAITYLKQKKYKEALYSAKKSEELSNELGVLTFQREIAQILSVIYENTGNYKKALASHQKFKALNDSLFNKENIEKISKIEAEYKYKQEIDSAKIRELKLTKTVKTTSQDLEQSQRNLLLGIIAFLGVSLLSGVIIFSLRLRNIRAVSENMMTEQKLLRSQMTPHFIFNALSVLQGMILNKENKKSVTYLSKFSRLLRLTLENSRDKRVLLQQELQAIENYLELQNIESSVPYAYSIRVDEAIDIDTITIPPMLIQPFIENAIEHGFPNQKENKKIDIHLYFVDAQLTCVITDNGVGVSAQKPNTNSTKKSLSTTITSERLQILSKDAKTKGSVTIEDRCTYNEQGTIVTMVLPYKKEKIS